MSTIKTLLTVFVHPDDVDHALYLIGEVALTEGGTAYTVQTGAEERITLDMPPFTVAHRQTQLIFALESPPTHHQIQEIAQEAVTGLIYGFTVRGEVNLGEGTTINNLGGLSGHRSKDEFMKNVELTRIQRGG
jgi:hypothetical protein